MCDNMKEYNRIGIYIFLINIALALFMITSESTMWLNYTIAILSTIVAIALNIYFLIKANKKTINIVFLVLCQACEIINISLHLNQILQFYHYKSISCQSNFPKYIY